MATMAMLIFNLEYYGTLYYFFGFAGMAWGAIAGMMLTLTVAAMRADAVSNEIFKAQKSAE